MHLTCFVVYAKSASFWKKAAPEAGSYVIQTFLYFLHMYSRCKIKITINQNIVGESTGLTA